MFKYALLLLVAGLIVFGVGVQGQMMQEKESSPMSHQCMAMMNMRQNMTAEMDTMDTKLEKMVATLKSAKGEDRWAAVTAILDELVSQRKAMREKMSQMHGQRYDG
jgi:hypothetical protein